MLRDDLCLHFDLTVGIANKAGPVHAFVFFRVCFGTEQSCPLVWRYGQVFELKPAERIFVMGLPLGSFRYYHMTISRIWTCTALVDQAYLPCL